MNAVRPPCLPDALIATKAITKGTPLKEARNNLIQFAFRAKNVLNATDKVGRSHSTTAHFIQQSSGHF